MSSDERQQRIDDAKARLRKALDDLDEQTRLHGEPPLREAVAAQARQRLAEEGHVTEPWNQTPLPNGTIRMTRPHRINPLTGKPYPTDMPDDEIETYHESRQVVANARAEMRAAAAERIRRAIAEEPT